MRATTAATTSATSARCRGRGCKYEVDKPRLLVLVEQLRELDGGTWPTQLVARTCSRLRHSAGTTCSHYIADEILVGGFGRPDLLCLLVDAPTGSTA